MTKINNTNNVQNIHAQKMNELSKKEKPQISTFEITDLKNTASEALGHSQVTETWQRRELFMELGTFLLFVTTSNP